MHGQRPIGVFDSGVGGLTVLKQLSRLLPKESFIYFADQKNVPYGSKKKRELRKITANAVRFLHEEKAKTIVMACNTATIYALDYLRSKFDLPIIGIVPIVKTAAQETKNGRIGILSTVATSKSLYQKELINKFASGLKVVNLGTDELVPFVEKGEIESPRLTKTLEVILSAFQRERIDTLALGCSHFPFLGKSIRKILGSVLILDSAAAISRQTKRVLEQNRALSDTRGELIFYTTGNVVKFKEVASKLLKKTIVRVNKATYNY